MTTETAPTTELVAQDQAPAREMVTISFRATLTFPESDAESFLAHLREWGTVDVEAPQAPTRPPSFDAYGNPHHGGSGERPTHDAYGNPYTPQPKVRHAPGTTDAYNNPLNPAPAPSHNHSAAGDGPRTDGRPQRDAYGNAYNGRY